MRNRVTYDTPIDALIAVAARLGSHENMHGVKSEDFYARYLAGEIPCEDRFMEWAMDYGNFMYLRDVVLRGMNHAA